MSMFVFAFWVVHWAAMRCARIQLDCIICVEKKVHWAAMRGNVDSLVSLLGLYADPNVKNHAGFT